jgi:hypothetical protein
MKKRLKLPPARILRQRFSYYPLTGILTYKDSSKGHGSAGWINGSGYWVVGINYEKFLVHRVIWKLVTGKDPKAEIDHADNDRQNNRWRNLREATESENLHNMKTPRHNTSGYKGVTWDKNRSKWMAKIQVSGRTTNLGRYSNRKEAHAAYMAGAVKYYGEFAHAG